MANLNETQIYEVFGVDAPSGAEGGNDQALAVPESQELPEAAQTQETPAAQPTQEKTGDEGSQTPPEEPVRKPQTEDQRRANAARRRQQEQQAAIDQAVKAEREKAEAAMAELLRRAGLKNTITGELITTMEQFNAWEQAFRTAKAESELKAGKLSKDTLDDLISQHPTVQAAAQVVKESEDAKRQAENEAARVRVNSDIQKISQLDPKIQSMEDILALPTAPAFYDYVQKKGLSVFDAFYLANRENLESTRAEAARQQALTNARGKDHLTAAGNGRGSGAMFVPADEMAMFRLFDPGAKESDIQAYYNTHKKK